MSALGTSSIYQIIQNFVSHVLHFMPFVPISERERLAMVMVMEDEVKTYHVTCKTRFALDDCLT